MAIAVPQHSEDVNSVLAAVTGGRMEAGAECFAKVPSVAYGTAVIL